MSEWVGRFNNREIGKSLLPSSYHIIHAVESYCIRSWIVFSDRTRMPLNHAEHLTAQTYLCKWVCSPFLICCWTFHCWVCLILLAVCVTINLYRLCCIGFVWRCLRDSCHLMCLWGKIAGTVTRAELSTTAMSMLGRETMFVAPLGVLSSPRAR